MSKDTDIHSCSYFCHIPACIKAQRDELRQKLDAALDVILDLGGEVRVPEMEEAKQRRKDSERLDWIAQQSLEDLSFALVVDGAGCGKYYVSGDAYEAGYGPTLRTAIDAAMAPKG